MPIRGGTKSDELTRDGVPIQHSIEDVDLVSTRQQAALGSPENSGDSPAAGTGLAMYSRWMWREWEAPRRPITLFAATGTANLVLLVAVYGVLLRPHYTVDTYPDAVSGHLNSRAHLELGRIVNWLICGVLNRLNINVVEHQAAFAIIFMIIAAAFSAYVAVKFLRLSSVFSIVKLLVLDLAALLSVANIFILEWYLFPEAVPCFSVGLLATLVSVHFVTKELRVSTVLASVVCLYVALNVYQILIELFVIWTIAYVVVNYRFAIKRAVIHSVVILLAAGVAGIASIMTLRVVQWAGYAPITNRDVNVSLSSLLKNFGYIGTSLQADVWFRGSGYMPFVNVAFGLVLVVCYVGCARGPKFKLWTIIPVLVISYGITFFPNLLTATVWPAPRTLVGFYSFLAVGSIILTFAKDSKWVLRVLAIGLASFLAINAYFVQTVAIGNFETNKLDQLTALQIQQQIDDYEQATGITVTKIAVCDDAYPTYGYYGLVSVVSYDTNLRAFAVGWAAVPMIDFYTGMHYQAVSMTDNAFSTYCADNNWDGFDPAKQLAFDGDTLNLAVY